MLHKVEELSFILDCLHTRNDWYSFIVTHEHTHFLSRKKSLESFTCVVWCMLLCITILDSSFEQSDYKIPNIKYILAFLSLSNELSKMIATT